MWSPIPLNPNDPARVPSSRCKHAAVVCDNHLYLLGGKNGNLPLRDFWKCSLDTNEWILVPALPNNPPSLQEHSIVAYENQLYIFGGEFSSSTETPLWIFDVKKHLWRKWKSWKGGLSPSGRRGHSAVLHRNSMYVYGGYLDMRGSTGELWAFNLDEEIWHLLSPMRGEPEVSMPSPRHTHSCVVFESKLWVFGGMTDLQERNDFWTWDLSRQSWSLVRAKNGPPPLHSHAAIKYGCSLYIFGGERQGQPTDELWRFHFATQTWFKVDLCLQRPQPRAQMACVVIPVPLKSSRRTTETILVTSVASSSNDSLSHGKIESENENKRQAVPKVDLSVEAASKAPLTSRIWPMYRSYSLLSNTDSDLIDLIQEFECEGENWNARFAKSQTHDSGIDSVRSGLVDSTNTLSSPCSRVPKLKSETGFNFQTRKTLSVTRSYTTVRFNPFTNEQQVRLIDLEESDGSDMSDGSHHRDFAEILNPHLKRSSEMESESARNLSDFSKTISQRDAKLSVAHQKHLDKENHTVLILGGREVGQITVFRRPLSIWKLQLY